MKTLLLDTNILGYEHNQHTLWQVYEPHLIGHVLCVAAQTVAEMRFGALRAAWGEARMARLEHLIARHVVIYPDNSICTEWARIKLESESKGRPMEVADIWIAATAQALDMPLVTHNRRDFNFLDDLELISEGR